MSVELWLPVAYAPSFSETSTGCRAACYTSVVTEMVPVTARMGLFESQQWDRVGLQGIIASWILPGIALCWTFKVHRFEQSGTMRASAAEAM